MTRARILTHAWYAPTFVLLALALALTVYGIPGWLPVALVAVSWPALWVAVSLAFEAQIAAWCAACPRHRAALARRAALAE